MPTTRRRLTLARRVHASLGGHISWTIYQGPLTCSEDFRVSFGLVEEVVGVRLSSRPRGGRRS